MARRHPAHRPLRVSLLGAALALALVPTACGDDLGDDGGDDLGDDGVDAHSPFSDAGYDDTGRPPFGDTSIPDAGREDVDTPDAPATDVADVRTDVRTDAESDAADVVEPDPAWRCLDDLCFDNPLWRMWISEAAWDALHEDVFADVRVPARLTIDGVDYELEVEIQGSSSRAFPKRSFKFHFDDHDPLIPDPFGLGEDEPYDKLVIKSSYKDQSFLREALGFAMLREVDLEAPNVSWINLAINGEYWGFYVLMEPIDRDFLRRRGYDDDGNLYKAIDRRATLGPGMDLRAGFEKRTNKDEPWDDLEALIAIIQTTPIEEDAFYALLDPIFPLDQQFARMMWVSYTQNVDTAGNNYFFYNQGSVEDPSWVRFAWDSDICFANHWRPEVDVYEMEWAHMIDGRGWLAKRLVSVDTIRHRYIEAFELLLDGAYSADSVAEVAEGLFQRIQVDADRDLERWDRPERAADEFAEVLDFIEQRPDHLRGILEHFWDETDIPDYFE